MATRKTTQDAGGRAGMAEGASKARGRPAELLAQLKAERKAA
jgi:hypothetical protein